MTLEPTATSIESNKGRSEEPSLPKRPPGGECNLPPTEETQAQKDLKAVLALLPQDMVAVVVNRTRAMLSSYRTIEEETTQVLHQLVQKTEGQLVGLDYRLKSFESLCRKLAGYALKRRQIDDINDVLRYTIVYDLHSYTDHVLETIRDLKEKGFKIAGIKNYWVDEKSCYKGINSVILFRFGNMIFELQFHTEGSYHAKQEMHPTLCMRRIGYWKLSLTSI